MLGEGCNAHKAQIVLHVGACTDIGSTVMAEVINEAVFEKRGL